MNPTAKGLLIAFGVLSVVVIAYSAIDTEETPGKGSLDFGKGSGAGGSSGGSSGGVDPEKQRMMDEQAAAANASAARDQLRDKAKAEASAIAGRLGLESAERAELRTWAIAFVDASNPPAMPSTDQISEAGLAIIARRTRPASGGGSGGIGVFFPAIGRGVGGAEA